MLVSKEYTVFAIRDSQRNTWLGIVEDLGQMIHTQGLVNNFDGTAQTLINWAVQMNYKCVVTKRVIEVEIPE